MKPIRTASSNFVYVGPEPVMDLHCERLASGQIRSVWALTKRERAAIAFGANIVLSVLVEPIPPLRLEVAHETGIEEDAPEVLDRLDDVVNGRPRE